MYTIRERWLIGKCWLLSFVRSEWSAHSYPVVTRRQLNSHSSEEWRAAILNWPGPVGLGSTEAEARAALLMELEKIAVMRRSAGEAMPRPGTLVPVQFASTERVAADLALLDDFIERALGFEPGGLLFVSDESSIGDFGDQDHAAEVGRRIHEHYGVVLEHPEQALIADVLERIRATRA